jgi:transposase-like protein
MNADTDYSVISPTGTESDTSTHTSGRKSARRQRIEVITTRGERRRRWSLEEKQAIVAESLAPNASLTAVARRHEIGTGLLYAWRHQLLGQVARLAPTPEVRERPGRPWIAPPAASQAPPAACRRPPPLRYRKSEGRRRSRPARAPTDAIRM